MPNAGANPFMSLVPLGAMFLIFYFLMIRPQQKQAKEHQQMLENLKKGDRVLTTGGVYGTIVGFRGNDLELKLAENVKVLIARSAITRLANENPSNSPAVANGVSV